MAEASKTVEMDIARDTLWRVILDYVKYPEFVEGAQTVKVISQEGGKARVEYGIQLLGKEIKYVLDHEKKSDERMEWSLVESNVLKANSGSWILKERGSNHTDVTYSLALDFKIYVPGIVLNGLVKSSLPKLLDNFGKRAKNGG